MGGSAPDIRISVRHEPAPDLDARMEQIQSSEGRLDDGRQKHVLKRLWGFVELNYILLFVVVFLQGFGIQEFELDPWVLVALISGVMGSTTIYFMRKSTDFAYSGLRQGDFR